MPRLNCYSVFHLNLAYSSLPESRMGDVVARCYRPLLALAEDAGAKIGIEASGYTLERIHEIDPPLLEKLKALMREKKCEFVGSGYMQIIGPLVPADVNARNLQIGMEVYERLLGARPDIAYVNEQAYSRSMPAHYRDAGYAAMVMEWNNPAACHPEWSREYQYFPQIASDGNGSRMPVLWNNSVAFQKFQRYATGEIELEEYAQYLRSHRGATDRFFPLYGSDAEVFDFRTMRYHEETPIITSGEWQRIRELFAYLSADSDFSLVLPSDALRTASGPSARREIQLESGEQPIPVKKRDAYNLTRWALTGRDSVGINTKCFQIYNNLIRAEEGDRASDRAAEPIRALWKELCYLWGSDFRTHITEEKFAAYLARLDHALDRSRSFSSKTISVNRVSKAPAPAPSVPVIARQGRHILIETPAVRMRLNVQKGLAIESLAFPAVGDRPLIGTVESGYYDDVSYAEDFFSGHTVIEIPMRPKIVDLAPVSVALPRAIPGTDRVSIEADIAIAEGVIEKRIDIFTDEQRVDLHYTFHLHNIFPASFRTCVLTFFPDAFQRDSLQYACHNGGREKETFRLEKDFRCGHLLSHLVSSRSAIGNTSGRFEIGDANTVITLATDPAQVAALPMIHFEDAGRDAYFLRTFYSLGEFDETSLISQERKNSEVDFSLTIIGKKISNL